MELTALIVSWNSAPDLPACLATLPSTVRVLVADNASEDDSVAVARAAGATVIEMGANVGFAAAVNAAVSEVESDHLLLLNPDVVVGPGAVERCLEELRADRSVGIVGPNTRLPDGRPEPPAARRDRSAAQILVESFGLVHLSRRLDRQMIADRSSDRDVDAVNGAFMMMRTDLLRTLGGLDSSVFMYLEDQDLCRRVRDAGHRIRFLADAHAVHGNGTSTARGDSGQRTRAYLNRIDADLEFLRRYGDRGATGAALAGFVLRSFLGMLVTLVVHRTRGPRYRSALRYCLRQIRGRVPAPRV